MAATAKTLSELANDNRTLTAAIRTVHGLCDRHDDATTASLLENWIDESERRAWSLYETTRCSGQ
jgi:starvation-inducible DNA-binding protein